MKNLLQTEPNESGQPPIQPPSALARAGGGGELAAEIESLATELQELGSFNAMINRVPKIRVKVLLEQVRGLEAVVQCWDANKKHYIEKVDFATRHKCATWIANYADGLPPQTNLNYNANTTVKDTPAPEATPATLEALERMVERMRRELQAKEKRALPV